MDAIHHETKENFECTENWLYLGANARDEGFAKVGITTKDLASRSSSSESPSYHMFCAFKCRYDINEDQLKRIEINALNYLEKVFVHPDGSTKRELHYESQRPSEVFHDVDFQDFLVGIHRYLYENYYNDFCTTGFEDCGSFLDCEFNRHISREEVNNYRRMLVQYDW